MIGVRVHVEQPRGPAGQGAAERIERRRVAALGEVRHGLERQHARTLSTRVGVNAVVTRRLYNRAERALPSGPAEGEDAHMR